MSKGNDKKVHDGHNNSCRYTDVVIVGVGFAGLYCAYKFSKNPFIKIIIIEQSVSPGGGTWLGGQLFSAMIIKILPFCMQLMLFIVLLISVCYQKTSYYLTHYICQRIIYNTTVTIIKSSQMLISQAC